MSIDSLQKLRKLYAILAATVVLMLLIVTAFVVHSVQRSERRYYDNAEETSRNLAISLETFLHAHFQEVDLTLRRAAEEFRTLHAQRRFNDASYSAYLRSLKERMPHARSIRGSDAAGRVIYGEDVDWLKPFDLTIREFFQRARTERELIFGVPITSRITGELVMPLVYALTLPDGTFGGTAYVNMNNAQMTELFSSLKIGPRGVITLLDRNKRLLHRYPHVDDIGIGTPIAMSPQTADVLSSDRRRATYTAVSARDGVQRVFSLEGIGRYPVYVLVGLSSEDFLAPWREEVRNDAIFLALLYVLAGALLTGARVALKRRYQALEQVLQKDQALQGSLAALTESDRRWRSLTEGLPQMVWTMTPALQLSFLSHHWQAYTGIAVDALLAASPWDDDNPWHTILDLDDRKKVEAEWARALAGGTQFRCDCRIRRHDGQWRVFDHHALPQRDDGGAIVAWVGSSTDMTEARAAQADMLLAKDQALAAGRAKSDFVANMSHEIRTPMNAVLGMLQLLQQTPMEMRQRDYAAKAEAAARALLGLLNDILDFSKVEAGKLTLENVPFAVNKLLRELSVILSANVGDKHVEVLFDIDAALPKWVTGDALRLQQVLLNLTGNAIKFTEHGEVMLSVTVVERDEQALHVRFAIRDTGIGISPEQCSRIFDGFSQAEASTARRYGGTGLGLAISQRLVALMSGTLGVHSVLGQGSTFEFTVPFQYADAPAPADAPSHQPSQPLPLHELDCLLVDDNPNALQVLGDMARSFGWRVETASDGLGALEAITRRGLDHPFDAVFIDWRMPVLDGWDTSVRVRDMLPAEQMPLIIMVTAHDREALAGKQAARERDRTARAVPVLDGVLAKPVTASMLFDAVADARLGLTAGTRAAPAVHSYQLRLDGLRILLVEDNPANQQVARELLGIQGAQVEVAPGGQDAIDAVLREGPLPDVILMDIQMPDMDGYEATGHILAALGEQAPPIIAMTANAMASDRAAALAAGMVDHVGKPFDMLQLADVIVHHVRGAEQRRANEADRYDEGLTEQQALAAALPLLNTEAALKRMGGLTQVYRIALRAFADEAVSLSAALHAGLEARRCDALAAPLHALKGVAATIGAERLAADAAHAERAANGARLDACRAAVAIVLVTLPDVVAAAARVVALADDDMAGQAAGAVDS